MANVLDFSVGFKKESVYGTAVTVDRFLEGITDAPSDYDRAYYESDATRPGSLLPLSRTSVLTKEGATLDLEHEVMSKGLGTYWELLLGTAGSAVVSGALYQQLFTLSKSNFLPSATIQQGLVMVDSSGTVVPHTFRGATAKSFELTMENGGILKAKSSWVARELDTAIAYATPSYPTPASTEVFNFVSAALTVGGTVTVPTTTALATGGTSVADVIDFSVAVDHDLDDEGRYIGGLGKRGRPPVGRMRKVTGKVSAEFASATYRDALRDNSALALVATFQAATDITASNKPTLQVVIPDVRFRGGLPQANKGDVIKQDLEFTAFDGLVAAHALYIATRTSDTAL